ncbi:MAG: purine-nucleoside phosphorylase [Coxiella sp. (in: Bacteria)]|nr:MAG: purine-nucleoside phosphorylase [Coxiella sp. (in: g-proteobacteria)]
MTAEAQQIKHLVAQAKPGFSAKVGIILGSGLGALADQITDATVIDYADIPGFPVSSVQGHSGKLHLGFLCGVPVACLQGRVHYYEGVDYQRMQTLIRSLRVLGCDTLFLTNSSGSLRQEVGVGELVAISDHINMQFHNPLVGLNHDESGPRFMGMENAYDSELRNQLHAAAKSQNITLHEGVYVGVLGPSFETPAEINAFRVLGADVVGMSTVADVIIARHCGLRVAALAAITNLAAGMHSEQLSHSVTLQGAKIASEKMIKVTLAFFESLAATH